MSENRCRYCLAEIEWGRTAKGYRIPLNPAGANGEYEPNLIVVDYLGEIPLVRYLYPNEPAGPDDHGLNDLDVRTSHFATCPEARRARRAR